MHRWPGAAGQLNHLVGEGGQRLGLNQQARAGQSGDVEADGAGDRDQPAKAVQTSS
jgi:hypothetical protein